MNTAIVTSILLSLAIIDLFFTGRSLNKSRANATVLAEKNALYHEFVENTNVKPFLAIMDTVSAKALDPEICFMLKEYFCKVLLVFDATKMHRLISDINSSKHADCLKKAFAQAIKEDGSDLLGQALFCVIKTCNLQGKQTIFSFLDNLSPETKTEQIVEALKLLEYFLEFELGDQVTSEYKEEIKNNFTELLILTAPAS